MGFCLVVQPDLDACEHKCRSGHFLRMHYSGVAANALSQNGLILSHRIFFDIFIKNQIFVTLDEEIVPQIHLTKMDFLGSDPVRVGYSLDHTRSRT